MIHAGPTYGGCGCPIYGPVVSDHKCRKASESPLPTPERERPAGTGAPSKPRPGAATEDALAALLQRDGYEVVTFKTWLGFLEAAAARAAGLILATCVREYPWGIHVARKYRSDFAFPLRMVLLEVEGGCHGVQRQRKSDILRRQLAEAHGYRVLSVLPEQVKDGTALALVRAALGVQA